VTTIAGSRDQGNRSQKHIRETPCTNENHRWRRGPPGGKADCLEATAISEPPIWCWVRIHYLELSWFRACHFPARERNLWQYLKWTEAGQQGILHPLDWVWSLVGDNRHSGTLENYWTGCNTVQISKDATCEPYIGVNSLNGFWWQFHHWYFWKATYPQCETGISIEQQSQLHLTDA